MKNPDIKNLRVAVVPVGGSNIDQGSSTEEILACPLTQLFPITDFFQAQNDEEFSDAYWTFLIDIERNVDITGSNIEGIHQFSEVLDEKTSMIDYIRRVIAEWGETTTSELELGSSPCIHSQGNKLNISHLVEEFKSDHVVVVVYANETETSDYTLEYEQLSDEILDEIYHIIQDYEADMLKTEKRCQS